MGLEITMRFKVFKKIGIKRFLYLFLLIYGTIWLFIDSITLFIPFLKQEGLFWYLCFVSFSIIVSFFYSIYKLSYSQKLKTLDSTVNLIVGDIFNQKDGHIVIGTNDVFDTELGEVIKPTSIQGQFLTKIYSGDVKKLDKDITDALQFESINPIGTDESKTIGKNIRFPIGSCLPLGSVINRHFMIVYTVMGSDLKCKPTDINTLWQSMDKLWKTIRRRGQSLEISMPIIGSDLARTGLTRKELLNLIITSFVLNSKDELITSKLNIYIHPKDLDHVNWYELKELIDQV
jgi:hypothetical protein